MPRPSPGSWPWLLAHELRLIWRSSGIRSRLMVAAAVVLLLLAHVAGWAMQAAGAPEELLRASPGTAIAVTVVVFFLVLSSSLGLAVRVLYERGDMDLLLSSPVPMRSVYAVRGIAVAVGAVASLAFFLLPFANMGPFVGRWRSLAAWPAIAALGLGSAAIAFVVTLALVRWLGLRRARVASQLAGAAVGVAFILLMQVPAMLPRATRRALHDWAFAPSRRAWFEAESPLLWPFRAFLGDAVPLAVIVAFAVAAFALVVWRTQDTFMRAIQEGPNAAIGRRAARAAGTRAFRGGLVRVVMAKELLLIARDPTLLAKALLQLFYLVPLFVLTIRRTQPLEFVAAALVLLAGGLAGTLAWIAVSGEEAPDLLRAAPVPMDRLRLLKVAAALAPVALLVSPFIAWYALTSLYGAFVAAAFVALSLASSAVVQVWATPLGGGRDLRRRFEQNPIVKVADTLSGFGWAIACYFTLQPSPALLGGLALGLLAPVAAWFAGREDR